MRMTVDIALHVFCDIARRKPIIFPLIMLPAAQNSGTVLFRGAAVLNIYGTLKDAVKRRLYCGGYFVYPFYLQQKAH